MNGFLRDENFLVRSGLPGFLPDRHFETRVESHPEFGPPVMVLKGQGLAGVDGDDRSGHGESGGLPGASEKEPRSNAVGASPVPLRSLRCRHLPRLSRAHRKRRGMSEGNPPRSQERGASRRRDAPHGPVLSAPPIEIDLGNGRHHRADGLPFSRKPQDPAGNGVLELVRRDGFLAPDAFNLLADFEHGFLGFIRLDGGYNREQSLAFGGHEHGISAIAPAFLLTDVHVDQSAKAISVIKTKETGRTDPWTVILDDGNTVRKAIFKYVDRPRPSPLPTSYRYELAAYEMAKLLGLDIVPPVIEREIDR